MNKTTTISTITIPTPHRPSPPTLQAGSLLSKNVTTSSRGEFWRLLLPGEYTLTAQLSACQTANIMLQSQPVQVLGCYTGIYHGSLCVQVILTEASPLTVVNLTLDNISGCPEGPR